MIADIANLIARQGEFAADAAARNGQIWAQTLSNLGQLAGNYPAEQLARTEAQQRQQIGQLQLSEAQRGIQSRQALADIVKRTPLTTVNGANVYDINAISKQMADAGYGDLVPEAAQHFSTINDGLQKIQEGKLLAAKGWAQRVQAAGNDPTFALAGIDDLKRTQAYPDHDIDQWASIIRANPTPENVGRFTAFLAGPQKLTIVPKGATALGPDNRPVFTPPPDTPKTAAEFAADAANPNSPTAAQSRAALNALNALTPYQQEELNLRNAAAAETARHNRVDESNAAQRLTQETAPTGGVAGANVPDVAPGQKNDAFLATLAPPIAAQVKALAEGRMAFPSGYALKSTYWQGLLQAVAKYDPSFDAVNYNARAKTRSDFTSGKSAQQVNAINTVVGHLAELSDKAEALNNSPYQFINSVRNMVRTQVGSSAVTSFETAKQAVANELTRVYRQAGGSESDIKDWEKSLSAANSPDQLRQAFKTIGGLLESKLSAMQSQYQQGMGTDAVSVITPKARVALDRLEGVSGGSAAVPSGRIRVRRKSDGQTGTILSGDFNPAVYEKVQ